MVLSNEFLERIGIFFVSLLLFTIGVNQQAIIGFESRFYVFALEMWQQGPSLFPTTYGRAYPDYPATFTFLTYLCALFAGGMSRLVAVFPTAIAASITVLLTYQIGALQNKRWGYYAVFLLLMTLAFFKNARSISLDMMITMVTTSCFYIIYSVDVTDKRTRTKWIYPLFLLGFSLRGPIGLVIPAGVVCLYYLQNAAFRRLFFVGAAALLLLMLCTLLLSFAAEHVGGLHFLDTVLRTEVVGRMGNDTSIYFYFTHLLQDYALSSILACITIIGVLYYEECLSVHTPALKLLLKLIGWVAVIMLGMSIPG